MSKHMHMQGNIVNDKDFVWFDDHLADPGQNVGTGQGSDCNSGACTETSCASSLCHGFGSLETGSVNSCWYDSTPTPCLVTALNSELNTINRNSQSPLGKIRNWDQGKIGATALGLRKMADSAKQNLSITMFLSGICPLNFLLQRVGPQSKIHSQKLNSDSQSQNNNAKPDSLVSILEYFFAW